MDYCETCGQPLENGVRYCKACGARVREQNGKTVDSLVSSVHERPNAMAIAAFCTALFGFGMLFFGGVIAAAYGIVAVCVGAVGWRQSAKRPQRGKMFGVLGLMVGILDVCLNVALYLQ